MKYGFFTNKLNFNYKNIEPTDYIPFNKITPIDTVILENLATSEFTLNFRFAQNEKFLRGEFEKVSLGTNKPVFNLNLTAGMKNIFNSQYKYYKINASIAHKLSLGPLGYLKYIVDAGKIFGTVPYPLLKLHEGNETYAFDRYAFNMMNYYEFASDRYASLFAEYHLQGLFLNKIPLMRKLKWREVVSAKGLIGRLSNKHQKMMAFPEGLHQVKDPYLEASLGIENIFKIFRIDAMWRLSYLEHQDIEKFGIRVKLQFVF